MDNYLAQLMFHGLKSDPDPNCNPDWSMVKRRRTAVQCIAMCLLIKLNDVGHLFQTYRKYYVGVCCMMPFLNTVILDIVYIVQEFVIPRNEKNVCIGHLNNV